MAEIFVIPKLKTLITVTYDLAPSTVSIDPSDQIYWIHPVSKTYSIVYFYVLQIVSMLCYFKFLSSTWFFIFVIFAPNSVIFAPTCSFGCNSASLPCFAHCQPQARGTGALQRQWDGWMQTCSGKKKRLQLIVKYCTCILVMTCDMFHHYPFCKCLFTE